MVQEMCYLYTSVQIAQQFERGQLVNDAWVQPQIIHGIDFLVEKLTTQVYHGMNLQAVDKIELHWPHLNVIDSKCRQITNCSSTKRLVCTKGNE